MLGRDVQIHGTAILFSNISPCSHELVCAHVIKRKRCTFFHHTGVFGTPMNRRKDVIAGSAGAERIDMTAPVLTSQEKLKEDVNQGNSGSAEKISMTAPVLTSGQCTVYTASVRAHATHTLTCQTRMHGIVSNARAFFDVVLSRTTKLNIFTSTRFPPPSPIGCPCPPTLRNRPASQSV